MATDDHMIPPPVHRSMADRAGATVGKPWAVTSYESQPAAVAELIEQAVAAS